MPLPPAIKLRGLRVPIPQGYLIGRISTGLGDAELVSFDQIGTLIASGISLTSLGVSVYIQTLLDDVDAATARGTLGLGTMAIQNASAVAITGGTINNTTIGASTATTGRFTTVQSTIATGTAPFIVASTTVVSNLNVSALLGSTWAAPAAIGSGTPAAGAFTTLSATGVITSTVATGTAPFTVASTTVVTNLNASLLGGATFAAPGAIGGTTPAAGAFTTLSATGVITSTVSTGTAPFTVASTTVVSNLNVSALLGSTWAAPAAIGSGTPAAGAFTTLSASSTVSGTGFSTYLASPPAIGGTVAAAGTFTGITLTVTPLPLASGGLAASTAAGGRTTLGLGTAAVANTGTSAGNVVILDGSAKLPAVDGSALTNLPSGSSIDEGQADFNAVIFTL